MVPTFYRAGLDLRKLGQLSFLCLNTENPCVWQEPAWVHQSLRAHGAEGRLVSGRGVGNRLRRWRLQSPRKRTAAVMGSLEASRVLFSMAMEHHLKHPLLWRYLEGKARQLRLASSAGWSEWSGPGVLRSGNKCVSHRPPVECWAGRRGTWQWVTTSQVS